MALPITGILSLVDYIQQLQAMRNMANSYSEADDAKRVAEMQTSMNTPEYAARFEDLVRDQNYGTIDPVLSYYVGPQTEDSDRFKIGENNLFRRLDALPVESNFTPEQLDAMRNSLYGTAPEVGPEPDYGSRPDFNGAGGDYMPRGGGKNLFDASYEDVEQYLRGGVVGRRRA